MNRYSLIALILFGISCLFFYVAYLNGELTIGIALIIPFVMGSSLYSFIAVIFLISAFFLFSYGSFLSFADSTSLENEHLSFSDIDRKKQVDTKVKAGGLIIIGPIPIVFGTSKKITIGLLGAAVIFVIVLYLLIR